MLKFNKYNNYHILNIEEVFERKKLLKFIYNIY